MDLRNLLKKNIKEVKNPQSLESLYSEFEDKETTKNNEGEDTPSKNSNLKMKFEKFLKKNKKNKKDTTLNFDTNEQTLEALQSNKKIKKNKLDYFSVNKNSMTSSEITLDSETIQSKIKRIPFLYRLHQNAQYKFVGVAFVLSSLLLIYGLVIYKQAEHEKYQAAELLGNIQAETQKLDTYFSGTLLGKKNAYDNLISNWNKSKTDLSSFKNLVSNLSEVTEEDRSKLINILNKNTDELTKNIEIVQKNSEFLKNTAERANAISADINTLSNLVDRMGMEYIQLGANQNEMANIYYLKNDLQIINENITKLLLAESVNPEVIAELAKTRQSFRKTLLEIFLGNQTKGVKSVENGIPKTIYKELANTWVHFSNIVDTVVMRGPELLKVRTLNVGNTQLIMNFDQDLKKAKEIINKNYEGLKLSGIIIITAIILMIGLLILSLYIYLYEKDNRNIIEKLDNKRNESSIYYLVNEMSPLQRGDLTKKTTVTGEITGFIADAINQTIESLSALVIKIKETSATMLRKTEEVNIISTELLKSNEEQANAIMVTGKDVLKIIHSIGEISEKTSQSAIVAQNSVRVSEEGEAQVLASLNSMKEINNNNNETVHLMQTVSDSSKQISEIVEVLSDIAEDTAILALNATVQAAKAGEAGKGFKIVADEIQILADSAGEKARTVGALIAAVQIAVQAVENAVSKTTVEVAKGVNLSEKAGDSLSQIKEVSYQLAEIVRTISEDTNQNKIISANVEKSMNSILIKTEDNQKSAQRTAASIAEISQLSNELRNSVQTFTTE